MRVSVARKTIGGALLLAIVAAPLVALGDVRDADRQIKAALPKKDFAEIDRGIQLARQTGGDKAAGLLIDFAKKMPPTEDQLYWRFVNGAASMRDFAGLEAVGKEIAKGQPLGRDLLYALANNRSQNVAQAALGPLVLKAPTDIALMAADQLGALEQVEAVDALIAGLEKHGKKESPLAARIERSLRYLTGADCGSADNWKKWWEIARKDGVKGKERRSAGTGTVVDTFDEGGPYGDFQELLKLDKSQVLVMTTECPRGGCNYDDISKLLDRMGVPHTPVTKQQFEKNEVNLQGVLALLLTCTQINEHCVCAACQPSGGPATNRMTQCTGCDRHDNISHKLSATAIGKIKQWVEAGGYLFTEDWGIADVVEPAWPKILSQGKMLRSRSARVSPGRGQTTHPLLKGVFLDPAVAEGSKAEGGSTVAREPGEVSAPIGAIERFWTIDDESPWIEVKDRGRVTVLMASEDLVQDCGPNGNAVAVTFMPVVAGAEKSVVQGDLERVRGGRVLHVLSHFAKQKSDQDAFALQNLLVNFLVEAQRRAPKR